MFVKVTDVSQVRGLAADTRIKVNGQDKRAGDYAELVVAGTPLLEVLAHLMSVEVEAPE